MDVEDDVSLKASTYQALKPAFLQEMADKKRREHTKAQVLYEQKGYCREGGEGDGY